MNGNQLSRRKWLRRTARLGAAALALPCIVPARVLSAPGRPGANDRLHVGVIGVGARGQYLIANLPDAARVVALCDCYVPRMRFAITPESTSPMAVPLAKFRAGDAKSCALFQNYRRMFDEAQLDAVVIATPDHQHILPGILACQAGLDLYTEKPLSLTIAEGRALVRAVAKHGRVCQVGSQQRTMEMNLFAAQLVRSGGIGKVSLVDTWNYAGPMIYSGLPEEPVPDELDWDLFCGPAPRRPHHRRLWVKDEFKVDGKLWRGWDLWRDYSGHLMTNWGGHAVDQIQWALGLDQTGPVEIWPVLDGYRGAMRLCPVSFRYANGTEVRCRAQDAAGRGGIFHGEKGKLEIGRNRFAANPPDLIQNPPDPSVLQKWEGPGNVAQPHLQNWLDCIRTRGQPNAPVEIGHRSATVCHLANIARELRRRLRWAPDQERFVGDEEANALLDRPRRKGFELPALD